MNVEPLSINMKLVKFRQVSLLPHCLCYGLSGFHKSASVLFMCSLEVITCITVSCHVCLNACPHLSGPLLKLVSAYMVGMYFRKYQRLLPITKKLSSSLTPV